MNDQLEHFTDPEYRECDRHGRYLDSWINGKGYRVCSTGCPECRREQLENQIFQTSAIPPRFAGKTFDSYQPQNDSQARALAFCRRFADDPKGYIARGISALFYGSYGLGKSHLAAALCVAVRRAGFSARFVSVSSLIREIRAEWGKGNELDKLKAFQTVDLLVLDELGVQYCSDSEALLLTDVINGRYEQMKPTFIVTNLSLPEIEKLLTPRCFDRLREGGGKAFKFEGVSYRRNAPLGD